MTTALKYTGTAPIWGTTIVGKPDRWYPGQTQDVSDADAALYLAAGNFQVVSPASVSGGGLPAAATTAVHRLIGGTTPSSSALVGTRCLKLEAEAPFDVVRLHLYHRETNVPTVFRALAAATESCSLASVAVAGQPTVTGAQTAALRSAVGAPGWARMLFAGANDGNFAGAGAAYLPAVLSSDYLDMPSVPRADGGTRPAAMFRVFHDGANTGAWNVAGGFTTDTDADKTAWENTRIYPWFRESQCNTITTTDGVTTPSTNLASATLSNAGVWAAVEFGYRGRCMSVLGIGSSLTEGGAASWGGFGSWGMRGCALASTVDRPVSWFQAGLAGRGSTDVLPAALAAIALHRPTHIVYELLNPNDQAAIGALTDNERAAVLSRLQAVARAARLVGARLAVWSAIPNNGYVLASDQFRQLLNSAATAAAASGAYDFINLESAVSNGASPARFKTGMAYDNTHWNNAGQDAASLVLRDYLLSRW